MQGGAGQVSNKCKARQSKGQEGRGLTSHCVDDVGDGAAAGEVVHRLGQALQR